MKMCSSVFVAIFSVYIWNIFCGFRSSSNIWSKNIMYITINCFHNFDKILHFPHFHCQFNIHMFPYRSFFRFVPFFIPQIYHIQYTKLHIKFSKQKRPKKKKTPKTKSSSTSSCCDFCFVLWQNMTLPTTTKTVMITQKYDRFFLLF